MVKLERREGVPAARQGSVSKKSTESWVTVRRWACVERMDSCVCMCVLVHTCVFACAYWYVVDEAPRYVRWN